MEFHHSFIVNAPLEVVRNFHAQSASMGAITPPPVIVRVHSAPALLSEGDTMDFTMWLGPLPVRWVAKIEAVTPTSFVDRMLQGPFNKWVHRHSFVAIDDKQTTVEDHVEVELSSNPFWKVVGGLMWLNLPVLFAFRQFKTRSILRSTVTHLSQDKEAIKK